MKIEVDMRKSINNVNNWLTLIDYLLIIKIKIISLQ